MDLAIQITRSGLTYAQRPLARQGEDFVGMFVRWSPRETASTILHLLRNSAAERVLFAVEAGSDPRRVEAARAAIAREDCTILDLPVQKDGAIGVMRAWIGQDTDGEERLPPHHGLPHRRMH